MPFVNITATFKTEPQDLVELSKSVHVFQRKTTLKRKRILSSFKQVIIRKPDSKITFLVYASGKIVCLGSRTKQQLRLACDWFLQTFETKEEGPAVISNYVYTFQSPYGPVPLERLFRSLQITQRRYFGQLEPETSPALIYQPMAVEGVKALIFRSGAVNVTGLRNERDIEPVLAELWYIMDPPNISSS